VHFVFCAPLTVIWILRYKSASRRRQALACPASFIFTYDVRRFYKFSDNIMLKNPYPMTPMPISVGKGDFAHSE
jgi:hypothetical protein